MNNDDRNGLEEAGYHPASDAYHLQHDWGSDDPLSLTVMQLIGTLTGNRPDTGEPLATSINPDALDELFGRDGTTHGSVDRLAFSHQGCHVTVHRDGLVVAYPQGGGNEPSLLEEDGRRV